MIGARHHHQDSPLWAGVPTTHHHRLCHVTPPISGCCYTCNRYLMNMVTIGLYEAVKKMRQLTDCGILFSIEFYSWNSTKKHSEGYKVVQMAQMRKGLRNNQSDKAQLLIGYVNYTEGVNRFFNLSLLMKFNGINIKP